MARKTRCFRLTDTEYAKVLKYAHSIKEKPIKLKDLRKFLEEKPDIARLMMETTLTAKEIEIALAAYPVMKAALLQQEAIREVKCSL